MKALGLCWWGSWCWLAVGLRQVSRSVLSSFRISKQGFQLFAENRWKVALTRETGANDKLAALLPEFDCIELPCLQFEDTDEAKLVGSALTSHDLIVVTSPQSATVLLQIWQSIGKPALKIATVGKGSSKPLIQAGLKPVFEPSEALGSVLVKELPANLGMLSQKNVANWYH
jgi:uroporphyrinogen-III synthase